MIATLLNDLERGSSLFMLSKALDAARRRPSSADWVLFYFRVGEVHDIEGSFDLKKGPVEQKGQTE